MLEKFLDVVTEMQMVERQIKIHSNSVIYQVATN